MIEERLGAQLLGGPPASDAVAVTERLLAVQAQDLRGARLAIRARTSGLTAADVDRELTDARTLVVTWLNRGTLHLVRREDYPWLQALTTPPIVSANARRLQQEGVPPAAGERAVEAVVRALGDRGPLTRGQLRDEVAATGVATAGQALVHVLMLASLRGLIVRGPVVAGGQAFVLVRDWLGEPRPVDRDRSLAELARRYLAGHSPATDRDLARWAGLGLRDARRALDAIAGTLTRRQDGSFSLTGSPPAPPLPAPRLLGPFDPLLMGWASREFVLGSNTTVVTTNGIFKPIALVGGRAVATWRMPGGEVVLEPFSKRLPAGAAQGIKAEARDVVRFLG